MSNKTATKTPTHTGVHAPKIGKDGLTNRARKRKNREKEEKEQNNKSEPLKPKTSFKYGQRNGKPRIPGNTSFDRSLVGKKIDTSNAVHWKGVLVDGYGWKRPCPAVDELRKSALDLINGTVEQDYRSFLYFYPGMDKAWETPMSSLLNQPLRQVWPIVGFTAVRPAILGFIPPFKPGFKSLNRKKVDEVVEQTGMSREDVKSFIFRGMSSVAIDKVAAYRRSIS